MSKRYATVDRKACVACGTCLKECVKKAISVWRGCHAAVDAAECVGCRKCEKVCPIGCIEIKEREEV